MYDFDKSVDRRGTGSMKWDIQAGELPMWVADMDFPTAPVVREALEKRVAHGVFGYHIVPQEWYEAYQSWWGRRHGLRIEKDWLIFCTGVVPALSSIVRKMTSVGENVLIQTPVYNIFFNSIVNNGRNVQQCPLRYENGEYGIDWVELEDALSNPQTSMMILCNPHNPVGKLWDRETLEKIGTLCAKHHVLVVSDEIHCDITDPGKQYIPFASVNETCKNNSITCLAPTKAFNLAGLQTAAVVVPDPVLRHRVWRGLNTDEVAEPNAFAVCGTVAAFTGGEAWLEALRQYLYENKLAAAEFIERELPRVHLVKSQATYLLWLDCSAYSRDSVVLADFIRSKTGLFVSEGAEYGRVGEPFLRVNIACPRQQMMEGLQRLKKGLDAFDKKK